MEATVSAIALREKLAVPLLSASLATDIGQGRFLATSEVDVTEGISIFRIRTTMSAQRAEITTRNRVYTTMSLGTGIGQVDAVQMVLCWIRQEPIN